MNRRTFAVGAASVVIAPLLSQGQPADRKWQIGFLGAETASTNRHFLDAFRLGMRERGYVEGQNITIEERWAEGRSERFHDLVVELIRLKMDVIVPISTPAVREAKDLTKTTPIVFIAADPVKTGLVSNLGRPGENLTGLSLTLGDEFAGKWLELLVDTVPQLSRVAILWNPSNPSNASFLKAIQSSNRTFRTTLSLHGVADASQFESAFRAMAGARPQALISNRPPPRADRRAGNQDPTADDLRVSGVRRRGWPHGVRAECCRGLPPRRRVCGQSPQGCQTRRPSGRAGHSVRVVDQPQDLQGARPHDPSVCVSAGRRDHPIMMDQRRRLLVAELGFAGCSMPSYDRALWALRTWLDSWPGIGRVAVGMHRQGYDLQQRGWRATFYTTGMEHSPTSTTGHRMGAHGVASGAAGGVGRVENGGNELTWKVVNGIGSGQCPGIPIRQKG